MLQTGVGLWMSNAWVIVLLVPVTAWLRWRVIAAEERHMVRQFGQVYLGYQASVPPGCRALSAAQHAAAADEQRGRASKDNTFFAPLAAERQDVRRTKGLVAFWPQLTSITVGTLVLCTVG